MKRFLAVTALTVGLVSAAPLVHADVHPGIQGVNDLLIQKGIVTKGEVEAQAKKHSLNITGYIQVQGLLYKTAHRVETRTVLRSEGQSLPHPAMPMKPEEGMHPSGRIYKADYGRG